MAGTSGRLIEPASTTSRRRRSPPAGALE